MDMKPGRMFKTFTIGAVMTILSAFVQGNSHHAEPRTRFPYKKEGLTERQAAAHLLSRFTFGARPGEVDEVVKTGPEKWLEQQLDGNLPDEEVTRRLTGYDALALDNETIVNTYLNAGQVIRIAAKNNLLNKDSVKNLDKPEYRARLKELMDRSGYKQPQELQRQLINQKIIRAAYGQNQLQEVLTDFWFNHFNVSLTKGQCQQYVLTYERDAIRPNVTGNFETLLEATAKHPAMLEYLDNALSVSNDNKLSRQVLNARKTQGLNENYAREIMELHTLGVDGGYAQKDVTEVARVLTGWSIRPMYKDRPEMKLMQVTEGDFLFRANKHDENEKTILGKKYPANGGYKEGRKVLEMLAIHPSTAKFICLKLATRFVSDTPSAVLVNKMAETFLKTNGNIKAVLIAMANNREFWNTAALHEKIKSPFEFAISAIRATNADIQEPFQIYNWCTRMGQRFYYYQAPTGFPDRASYWINTGSLLNRMNFGLAFATEKIPGVKLNLTALNDNHEPESAEAALVVYSKILLPERNLDENVKRLTALVRDATVAKKITQAADKHSVSRKNLPVTNLYVAGNSNPMSQIVGIILGSPEFQRK